MLSFKMKLLLALLNFHPFFVDGAKIIPYLGKEKGRERREYHFLDKIHMPDWFKPPPEKAENGTEMPDPEITPDYRVVEPPFIGHPARKIYYEFHRPIRISPHYKQTYRWSGHHKFFVQSTNDEVPANLGCYCTTVYRKFILLAGCAVLTTRHVLTTASSTDLVLKRLLVKKPKTVYNELGFWYDNNLDTFNSSMYSGPARIHHHPRYKGPHTVNISHPIPCHYDLSLWTAVTRLYSYACTCSRGGSHWLEYKSSTPRTGDIAHIVGFQFVKAHKKVPMPWFKYVVRSKKHIVPCPKTEWGWFHCLLGSWAKFGVESGAAWHRALQNRYWLYDGLIGMAAFSMHLRSEEITHYFTIVNVNHVLDFLYDAYMGMLPVQFLDGRFEDTKWRAPKPTEEVTPDYTLGEERLYGHELPWFKK